MSRIEELRTLLVDMHRSQYAAELLAEYTALVEAAQLERDCQACCAGCQEVEDTETPAARQWDEHYDAFMWMHGHRTCGATSILSANYQRTQEAKSGDR